MSAILSKPLDSLNSTDVSELTATKYPEGPSVEFKEKLPFKKRDKTDSDTADRWYSDQSKGIYDYARDEILEEVVAFANAHGGHVILGIEESSEKPPRAAAINPIPKCHDLAERLQSQARDLIEPQIPLVIFHGVATEGDAGVVVIRVPESRLAPHRLKSTKQCYVRRNDRSEAMSMREIQDLTIFRLTAGRRIEERLAARADEFQRIVALTKSANANDFTALRATIVPVGAELGVPRVHNRAEFTPYADQVLLSANIIGNMFSVSQIPRPLLRGTRFEGGNANLRGWIDIFQDGLVEFIQIRAVPKDGPTLSVFNVLGVVANAMLTADNFRQRAGGPEVELAMDIELRRAVGPAIRLGQLGVFEPENPLTPHPYIAPRYSLGPVNEFGAVIAQAYTDLRDASGEHPGTPITFTVVPVNPLR